jgi:hypothetical protein
MKNRQSESSSDIMHHPSETTHHRPEPPDAIDADPVIDRLPAIRSRGEASRLLEILDSLPTGTGERRSA